MLEIAGPSPFFMSLIFGVVPRRILGLVFFFKVLFSSCATTNFGTCLFFKAYLVVVPRRILGLVFFSKLI